MIESGWSRGDVIAAWSLGVAVVGGIGTWLTVPQLQPAWLRRRRNQIEITLPRPGETLSDSKRLPPGLCFRVTGRVGFVPEGHRIWLLVKPRGLKGYWPQGFEAVTHNPASGEWWGYIYEPAGKALITIVAVVAPRSAQMFFVYYQKHGSKTNWDPIEAIPDECRNRHEVEVRTP